MTDRSNVKGEKDLKPRSEPVSSISLIETAIDGCYELYYPVARDHRGEFVKPFNKTMFEGLGLETEFPECFYSVSDVGVLRGMHFQLPPDDHAKLLYCISGKILDVAVDLRKGSPAYGQCAAFELSAIEHTAAYLPRGVAHGFYVLEPACVMYHVSSQYSPTRDAGIKWDSFGFDWPDRNPILSKRDMEFQSLAEFDSPFSFTPARVLKNDKE